MTRSQERGKRFEINFRPNKRLASGIRLIISGSRSRIRAPLPKPPRDTWPSFLASSTPLLAPPRHGPAGAAQRQGAKGEKWRASIHSHAPVLSLRCSPAAGASSGPRRAHGAPGSGAPSSGPGSTACARVPHSPRELRSVHLHGREGKRQGAAAGTGRDIPRVTAGLPHRPSRPRRGSLQQESRLSRAGLRQLLRRRQHPPPPHGAQRPPRRKDGKGRTGRQAMCSAWPSPGGSAAAAPGYRAGAGPGEGQGRAGAGGQRGSGGGAAGAEPGPSPLGARHPPRGAACVPGRVKTFSGRKGNFYLREKKT